MHRALPPRLKAVGQKGYLQTRIDARSNVEEEGGIAAQLYTACLDVLADLYRIFAKNDFDESHTVASADLVVKSTDSRIGHRPRLYNIRADRNDEIADGIFADRNLLESSQRNHSSGTIARLESSGKRSIKDALGKLFLWGEDLMDGGLDRALGESDELRDHVLELLCGIAIILQHRLLSLVAVQPPQGALQRRLQDLDFLMAHSISITSRDCTQTFKPGDDTEEVYFSESDVSCHGGSSEGEITDIKTNHYRVLDIGKELKFRTQCLMDLLPTLEQNIALVELRRKPPNPLTPIPPPFDYDQASEEFRGGLPGEQAKKTKKDGKAKAGDQKSKGDPAKKDVKGQHAYADPFESDFSDSSSSADSVFSAAETIRTRSTDFSSHREEKRYSSGQRDGYRSSHRSRERDHDDYERVNHRDHVPHRRDSQRSSRRNYDFNSIRQHRRKSPLRSSNSSLSTGGARYIFDEEMFTTNGRRGRRGSEYSLEEPPPPRSRNDLYEDSYPKRKPGMYTAKRMSGMPGYLRPVEVIDERDELKETVPVQVKQELDKEKIEQLKRENERLKEEGYRPGLIINERERFPRYYL